MNSAAEKRLVRLAGWLAAPAMLVGPILNYLKFNAYPLFAAEALLAIATFLAIGMTVSLVCRPLGSPLRAAIMTLASLVVFDQLLSGAGGQGPEKAINAIAGIVGLSVVPLVYFVVIMALAFFWARVRFAYVFAAVSFGVMALAIVLTPAGTVHQTSRSVKKEMTINPGLPPLLHIIVDEHQGLAGFPRDIAGASDLAARLQERYRKLGFVVYPNAYSSYAQTAFAIPAMLNNQTGRAAAEPLTWKDGVATLRRNKWLTQLAARGYQVRVYGSSYFDFCRDGAVSFCQTYSRNSIHSLLGVDLPAMQKYRVILDSFSDDLLLVWLANRTLEGIKSELFYRSPEGDPLWQEKAPRLGPLAAFATIKDIAADIRQGAAGRVFFAHLILPHYSYVFEEDCGLNQDAGQWLNRTQQKGTNSDKGRRLRYDRYFKQTQCLHTALERIYEALRSTGFYDKATIILHGDHGSRIARADINAKSLKRVSRQDLIDAYSTLYAVKRPGRTGAVNPETRSVQDMFGAQFLGAAAAAKSPLYLRDEAGSQGATNLSEPLGTVAMPPGFPRAQ